MSKIKKYKQFNESNSLSYEDVSDIFLEVIDNVGGPSYTRIARNYSENEDLELEIYKALIESGLTDEILKKHIQQLAGEFDGVNGVVDLFFYRYLKLWNTPYKIRKKMDSQPIEMEYPLSGSNLHDSDYNELYIKYKYGYHNTYYGRLYLKQAYDTIDQFYIDLAKRLPLEIYDNIHCFWTRADIDEITNSDMRHKIRDTFVSNFIRIGNKIEIDWYTLYNDLEYIRPTRFDDSKDFLESLKSLIMVEYSGLVNDISHRKIRVSFGEDDENED